MRLPLALAELQAILAGVPRKRLVSSPRGGRRVPLGCYSVVKTLCID